MFTLPGQTDWFTGALIHGEWQECVTAQCFYFSIYLLSEDYAESGGSVYFFDS
jgi:hypothetical protein